MSPKHEARKNAIEPYMTSEFIQRNFAYDVNSFLKGKYEDQKQFLGKVTQGHVIRIKARDSGTCFALKLPKFDNLGSEKPEKKDQISWIAKECCLFEREAKFLESITHQNVVCLIEFFRADIDLGPPFTGLVLELMDGSLNGLIENPPGDQQMVFDFFKKGVDVLCYFQGQQIIHGDVKPANWLYKKLDNDKYEFKLTDFGLAKREGGQNNGNGGTHSFAAPEAIHCRPNKDQEWIVYKSDLWSHFVTVAWALNADGIRTMLFSTKKKYGENLAEYQQLEGRLRKAARLDPRLSMWKNIFKSVRNRPSAEKIRDTLIARTSF